MIDDDGDHQEYERMELIAAEVQGPGLSCGTMVAGWDKKVWIGMREETWSEVVFTQHGLNCWSQGLLSFIF